MLGPDNHLYDLLPNPTPIRVLLFAPGKLENDVFSSLPSCNLDEDRTIDPCVLCLFEGTCIATAKTPDGEDRTQRFILQLGSYIHGSEEDAAPNAHTEPTSVNRNQHTSEQSAREASISPVSTARLAAASNVAGKSRDVNGRAE